MKINLKVVSFAAALLALAALPFIPHSVEPAKAGSQVLCTGDVSGAPIGPRQTFNPNVPPPDRGGTGVYYQLNGQGCLTANTTADIGYFQSQGYTQGSPTGSIVYQTGALAGQLAPIQIGNVPANAYISAIVLSNWTANAVTGGLDFGNGTTPATSNAISNAAACAANCLNVPSITQVFAGAAGTGGAVTPVWVAAHTSWNSANLTITIVYTVF